MVGAIEGENVSESAEEESTEQYEFIYDLNHPEIVVRIVKHSEFTKIPKRKKTSHR